MNHIAILEDITVKDIPIHDVKDCDVDRFLDKLEKAVDLYNIVCDARCLQRMRVSIVNETTQIVDKVEMNRLKSVEDSVKLFGSYFK